MLDLNFLRLGRVRFLLALLFTVGVLLRLVSWDEIAVGSPELAMLPNEIGTWKLTGESTLEKEVADVLRPDEYVLRSYQNGGDALDLFVAFFKSQRSGYGPHSPQMCLPGAGWLPQQVKVLDLPVGDGRVVPVNHYILEKGKQRIMVLYWYQNGRHIWAEEFRAKFYLIPDIIRHKRSDVVLVRVVVPVTGEIEAASGTSVRFAQLVLPLVQQRLSRT